MSVYFRVISLFFLWICTNLVLLLAIFANLLRRSKNCTPKFRFGPTWPTANTLSVMDDLLKCSLVVTYSYICMRDVISVNKWVALLFEMQDREWFASSDFVTCLMGFRCIYVVFHECKSFAVDADDHRSDAVILRRGRSGESIFGRKR